MPSSTLITSIGSFTENACSEEKVKAYKKFANKSWNVARFIYSNTDDFDYENFDSNKLTDYEKNTLTKFDDLIAEITDEMKEYNLYLTSEKLYHFIWHELADVILEESKDALTDKTTKENKENVQFMLLKLLENILKAVHPFMPFVTEEIWADFPKKDKRLLMIETWPNTQ